MVNATLPWRVLLFAALAGTGAMTACQPTDTAATDGLSPTAVLVRASLDLRGRRPSPDELRQVATNPDALDGLIDGFLEDDAFARRIKDLFAPAFRTRVDEYPYADGDEEDGETYLVLGEEPLDLVAYIAMNDRPYTDLVLAPFTVATEGMLARWPLEPIDDDGAWLPEETVLATYDDARPNTGVISMNTLWWRHTSTEENANRGRANALSRALLCESFLDRPIDFPNDIDLTDTESIHAAIRENQGCTACHATLDPLASYLWGFMYRGENAEAWARYNPAGERDWMFTTEREPGFFGTPGATLHDLGAQLANDPRYVTCAVERVTEGLLGRDLTLDDDGALAEHREAFIHGGLTLRALVKSVVRSPAYRGRTEKSAFGGTPAAVKTKLVTPDILADNLHALTGYRLRDEVGVDAVRRDFGLRAVAGGSDSGAATLPSTGLVLVQRRLAERAASAAFRGGDDWDDIDDEGFEDEGEWTFEEGALHAVLEEIEREARPTRETLDALLSTAQSRVGDTAAQDALLSLWDELAQNAGPEGAWQGVLTAVLADPDHLLY
jgi:hypothetical protein